MRKRGPTGRVRCKDLERGSTFLLLGLHSSIFSHLTATMFLFHTGAAVFSGRTLGLRLRLFSSTSARSRFLPFEEARAWARGLGLRSAREWEKFRDRPPYIPAEPQKVYKGVFVGIEDFLGYRRLQRSSRRSERSPPVSRHVCTKHLVQRQLIDAFVGIVQKYAPSFEFVAMPRDSRVAVLFRPSAESQGWCGLHFRTSNRRNSQNTATFSYIERCNEAALVLVDKVGNRFYILDQQDVSMRSICIPDSSCEARSGWDRFFVDEEHISQRLKSVYVQGPLRSDEQWLSSLSESVELPLRSPSGGGHIATMINRFGLSWLTEVLKPADVSMTYGDDQSSLHNMEIDGRRCLVRIGYARRDGRISRLIHLSKSHRKVAFPYDTGDEIDFVIGIPSDGTATRPRGCFVFPKQLLVEQGFFSQENEGGRLQLALYPPDIENRRNDLRVRLVQQWQSPFWVDFSGEGDSLVDARNKFFYILRNA